jgi:DDE family transposase
MEHQLWKAIVAVLLTVDKRRKTTDEDYSDEQIVATYYWAVVHDRPVSWACQSRNWPPHLRRKKPPSSSTMSRRMRTRSVIALLNALEQRVLPPQGPSPMIWYIDGKPLQFGGCSKDRQAGYGRAAGGKGKGYKLHAIIGSDGSVGGWRVAPMNKDERVMGKRLVRNSQIQGYLLGDANYDSNELHKTCEEHGELQLVCRRRYGEGKGHGHRKQTEGRMRSKELLENPQPDFGKELYKMRGAIERFFGGLSNAGGSMTHLPAWVRTHRRVHLWVQAKLVLNAVRRRPQLWTCAAG